ncbi:hypothetical protein [Desulforhopalus sp. 52FAK]
MQLRTLKIMRLSIGLTTSVVVAYGAAWMLFFLTPIFTFLFLAMPGWPGWKMALELILRLAYSLIIGIIIAEFFLQYPLLCIPLYGLIFFIIYYNDTPTAPPMSTLFMTLAVTMIPIMSFSGLAVSHVIAHYLLMNMSAGLFFAWFFHLLFPNSLALPPTEHPPPTPPQPPVLPDDSERIRLAMTSTIVATSAVIIFFALNLSQYALAMIYICFMAGTPNTNASVVVMKANATATCIGGIAVIIAYNLLVAVPTYPFLIILSSVFFLFFSSKIFGGSQHTAAFSSGLTTFLVLLGSSTGVDQSAGTNFYLRIAQVLFAGMFTLGALIVVEHISRPRRSLMRWLYRKLLI